ncbi:ABC transporter ATP-binding protein [Oceaniglobus trochenteri]|uniref:ABC transporter ATP-binding protein n=1 Tax=Oceaniglobus trochenteri TaxID=2763260 RepID=UPI001CFF73F7|nr:ABC transporter ATP-binding protein [Oceaniglobus trochenteri]
MTGAPLLDVTDLTVSLPHPDGSRLFAVRDLNLRVGAGQIAGLAGESGSGKSITSLALMGLLPDGAKVSGSAMFEGRDLLSMSARDRAALRGRQMAMIFQDPMTALHPMLSIGRQMTEHYRHHFATTQAKAMRRAEEMLDLVRIPDPRGALKRSPHQFSGGMRQRIAIAMALCCEPTLIIADEPTTALDVTVQAGILRLFERLRGELDLSVLLITHDLGVMSAVADRVSVMYAGRLVEGGARADVLTRPRHPYTHGLLNALPGAGGSGGMQTIPGLPPSIATHPPGCAFHPRCPFCAPSCKVDTPPLVAISDDRRIACPIDPLAPKKVTAS